MGDLRPRPWMARVAIYALTGLALTMVSTVVYVLVTGDEQDGAPTEAEVEKPSAEFTNPPVLVFPEHLRTYDSSLNRFIDRFIRATLEGRYNEFRQMWTRRLDPVSAEKYLRIWNAVREVRVLDVQPLRRPDGSIEAYLIEAEVKQDPASVTRQRQAEVTRWIRVVREGDDWVFAPPEKMDRDRVNGAATQAATRPANGE